MERKIQEALDKRDEKEEKNAAVGKAEKLVEISLEDAPRVTAAQVKADIDIVVED